MSSEIKGQSLVEGYEFSQDWFSNHIPTWTHLLARLQPTRSLEIGCYEGRATTYLIEACAKFGRSHLTCVDTWAGSNDLPAQAMTGVEARFDRNVDRAIAISGAAVELRKIKLPSAKAMSYFVSTEEEQFDLIYIDGSHAAPDVLIDAVLAFQLLRVGGVMIFDDYLWSMEPALFVDPLNMPKPAIDAFTTIFMRKARLIAGLSNSQCYVEKIAA